MGNVLSSPSTKARDIKHVTASANEAMDASETPNEDNEVDEFHDTESDISARAKTREENMNEFTKQLNIKREQRKQILARHRAEKETLEKSLADEKKAKLELYESNKRLRELLTENNIEIPENMPANQEESELTRVVSNMREESDELKSNNNKLRRNLVESNSALQNAYTHIADLNAQNTEFIKQIRALKEVISVSKTMISLREQQLNALKSKLTEIEQSLADRESSMLSVDLRQEYVRQLQNIRTLRGLYEERARLAEVNKQSLIRELEEQKELYQIEANKCKDLNTKVDELEKNLNDLRETIENKEDQIFSFQRETDELKAEMSAVNKLFSQILLGYKSRQDFDTLVHRLEENHGILTHMAVRENGSEASSALPKLLLDLISQVDENEEKNNTANLENNNECTEEAEKSTENNDVERPGNTTAEEIVQNLPKVWKVLMELLSHQTISDASPTEKVTTCFKSVETTSGPVLVPSVSQTYIRLKDLIVEKLSLVKEVNRMKQLNTHLETRLEEQEKRLCLVTTELSKTWHVVSRLRRHHHQLHTHEKILKYELQQKRKLLNELKEELEYCREKWEQAREKNSQSERDWKKLRAEFSSRKTKSTSPSLNNSAESGYSDERPSDDSESNDESEYVTEPLIRSKKKNKKSFETILDSSTDFNLAAEREDPVSDLLDVADLPLDTQDISESASGSLNCDKLSSNEKICEETEDEVCDITNDSCAEESCDAEHYCNSDYCCIGPSSSREVATNENQADNNTDKSGLTNVPMIDTATILENIKKQNIMLTKKDENLKSLENNSDILLQKIKTNIETGDQINNILDHLINRPSSSRLDNMQTENEIESIKDKNSKHLEENVEDIPKESNEKGTCAEHDEKTIEMLNSVLLLSTSSERNESKITDQINETAIEDLTMIHRKLSESEQTIGSEPNAHGVPNTVIDPKAILESIRQQNKRLAKRDMKLKNLEEGCSQVVQNITNTLNSGENMIEKLDALHNDRQKEIDAAASAGEEPVNDDIVMTDDCEPSTSGDVDHEAIFAARDLRLKRLEEQTKSLVNKVNNTASKGVKIHYKLEELHNIYGSESSRAGTPSEDNEDRSQNSDEINEEQNEK